LKTSINSLSTSDVDSLVFGYALTSIMFISYSSYNLSIILAIRNLY